MKKVLENQFETHDILKEVINKPKNFKANLASAYTLKPLRNNS
jgi:hypothetical protein